MNWPAASGYPLGRTTPAAPWVLIVDPKSRSAGKAGDALNSAGLALGKVRETTAGSTALREVKHNHFRFVVVDPAIAVVEPAGFIRQLIEASARPVTVIAWTSVTDRDACKAFTDAGAYAVVAKDDLADLVAEVRSALGRRAPST